MLFRSGDTYPFFKSELGNVDTGVTPSPIVAQEQPSPREKLVALIVRLPEECLEDAIVLLKERFDFHYLKEPLCEVPTR